MVNTMKSNFSMKLYSVLIAAGPAAIKAAEMAASGYTDFFFRGDELVFPKGSWKLPEEVIKLPLPEWVEWELLPGAWPPDFVGLGGRYVLRSEAAEAVRGFRDELNALIEG